MAFFGSSNAAATSTTGDTSKDIEVKREECPTDSISDLSFNPAIDLLAVSSWDKNVYIYELSQQTGVGGKWKFEMPAHVLCVAWSKDGTRLAAGDTEGNLSMLDLRTNPNPGVVANVPTIPKAHPGGNGLQGTIKCCRWFQTNGQDFLATGSWDKTVKFWDFNSTNPIGTLDCAERVYSMDVKDNLMVVATAERHIHMVNLNEPQKIFKTMTSPLKWQTRTVSCFTDATGFAVGSIEGRCAIQYAEDKNTSLNFSFKCHRQQDQANRDVAKVYSVNCISFHPVHGTFSTAGSDGTFHFWDKDAKHRLKGYPEVGGSITATGFSREGNVFAYAISYDWSKGYSVNSPNQPIKLKLHPIVGDECKPRPGSKKR